MLNLDDSVAITQNYVSASNLADVLDFLARKPDQISGVRDRPEAVDADLLREAFVAALAEAHPGPLAEAEVGGARVAEAWACVCSRLSLSIYLFAHSGPFAKKGTG